MKRTLGGDRINSGNKMQVDIHGYGRSTFNKNRRHKTTMAAGTLVPLYIEPALPQDDWEVKMNIDVLTKPTNGPLFGRFSVEVHLYTFDVRLYNSWLHNNKLGVGNRMQDVKLPLIQWIVKQPNITQPLDNQMTNPSSLMAMLGNRGLGVDRSTPPADEITGTVNALTLLGYWEIYKQYYSNKQEGIGGYIHATPTVIKTVDSINIVNGNDAPVLLPIAPGGTTIVLERDSKAIISYTGATPNLNQIMVAINGSEFLPINEIFTYSQGETGAILLSTINRIYNGMPISQWRYINAEDLRDQPPAVETFPLENIDAIRELLLATSGDVPFTINQGSLAPYGPPLQLNVTTDEVPPLMSSQEGLAVISYKSDKFNNWLDTESIDGVNGINAVTAVDTSGGSFEIEALILAKKIYLMMNRIQASGGSYKDWMEVNWTEDYNFNAETPVYQGGLMKELVFQEVVSNSASEEQPLGTLAGRGQIGQKHKGGHANFKTKSHAMVMAVASITPYLDYTQGNAWWTNITTMDDWHKPALDGIGFQDSLTGLMAWWDNSIIDEELVQHSAGKLPAWTNYKTDVNVASGNFAIENSEMWMVLARRYEQDINGRIADLTTLIDPVKFNHIFAQTSRDAMNFWVQADFEVTVRRSMSSEDLPNL